MTAAERTLVERGFRLTGQRYEVIELLKRAGRHMTAMEIYERLRGTRRQVSLATIYRTLSILEELRIVRRVELPDHPAVYELVAANGSVKPHGHLICTRCGAVEDVELTELPNVEELARKVGSQHGFQVCDVQVVVYGLCARCSAQNRKN